MTISLSAEPSVLRGAQRPRICQIPEYASSAGEEAIEVAALAGLELDEWQQFVLMHSLGERVDGKWAAPTVGLVVGRQNGKNAVLEARELVGLFLLGEQVIIHSAHEQATASEQFRRVLGRIEGVPDFDRRVMKVVKGKGSEAIELRGGQRILFKTRTGGGGRGFSVDLIVFDESMILPEAAIGALIPTMAARSMNSNIQTWYAGSAVDQDKHDHGVVLARIRERGIAKTDGIAYFEWSAPGEDPQRVAAEIAASPEIWALANPGLGIRISQGWVEHERTVEMGPREFAVERLGIGDWPDTSEDAGRVISREAWADIAEHDPANRITSPPMFAVDVNPDQTWGAIGVAGKREDGLVQFAVVAHERGTDWLVERCKQLKVQYPRAQFPVDKRGPAAEKIEELKAAKLKVIEISTEDYGRACAGLLSGINEKRLRYPFPQPELEDALAGARAKALGDAWKWSRRDSTSADISPLVAVTLASWAVEHAKPRSRVINPYDYV